MSMLAQWKAEMQKPPLPPPAHPAPTPSVEQAQEALLHRARIGVLLTAEHGNRNRHAFWQGYAKGIKDRAGQCGIQLATKDAASGGYLPPSYLQAAYAALPVDIERLPLSDVQKFLATHGIQIAPQSVTQGNFDTVEQLENGMATGIQPHDEQASCTVEVNDGSRLHGAASNSVVNTGIVNALALRMQRPQATPDTIRSAFEADYLGDGPRASHTMERSGDGYKYMAASVAWGTWQRAWNTAATQGGAE